MNHSLLRWCAGASLLLAAPLSFACSGALHIEIEHEGVYALDYASVIAKQPKLADCRADQLLLSHRDGDVPVRVLADAKGMFGPGSRIEWIGHHLRGPESYNDHFSINNVYLLRAADGSHPRIEDARASGNGAARLQRVVHLEEDRMMIRLDQSQQKIGTEPDVWQWAKMTQVDPEPFKVAFNLPDLAARGQATLWAASWTGGLMLRRQGRWVADPGNATLPRSMTLSLANTTTIGGARRQWVGSGSHSLWYREEGHSDWTQWRADDVNVAQVESLVDRMAAALGLLREARKEVDAGIRARELLDGGGSHIERAKIIKHEITRALEASGIDTSNVKGGE